MQPYAQHPALRSRQVAADLGMLVWLIGWGTRLRDDGAPV